MSFLSPIDDRVGESYTDVWNKGNLVIMQRNSIPGLNAYAPAFGLLDWGDFFGDEFCALVDLDAVELRPIAGDPGGVARVSVLALFYRQVNEDRVMQHEGVSGEYRQPQCIGHCHFLKDWFVDVDSVVYYGGVSLDFYVGMAGVLVFVDYCSHTIDDVEQQQDAEDSGDEPQAVEEGFFLILHGD